MASLRGVRSLEVHNFKSYHGTTKIGPFKDFTAIVGPNGSGKSNIFDSFIFALGITTNKIRADRLCDLVNNEASTQDPSATAYVELTFVNSPGEILTFRRTITLIGPTLRAHGSNYDDSDEYGESGSDNDEIVTPKKAKKKKKRNTSKKRQNDSAAFDALSSSSRATGVRTIWAVNGQLVSSKEDYLSALAKIGLGFSHRDYIYVGDSEHTNDHVLGDLISSLISDIDGFNSTVDKITKDGSVNYKKYTKALSKLSSIGGQSESNTEQSQNDQTFLTLNKIEEGLLLYSTLEPIHKNDLPPFILPQQHVQIFSHMTPDQLYNVINAASGNSVLSVILSQVSTLYTQHHYHIIRYQNLLSHFTQEKLLLKQQHHDYQLYLHKVREHNELLLEYYLYTLYCNDITLYAFICTLLYYNNKLSYWKKRGAIIQQTYQEYEVELIQTKKDINTKKRTVNQLEYTLSQPKDTIKQLNDSVVKSQDRYTNLQSQITEMDHTIDDFNNKIELLNIDLDQYNAQYTQLLNTQFGQQDDDGENKKKAKKDKSPPESTVYNYYGNNHITPETIDEFYKLKSLFDYKWNEYCVKQQQQTIQLSGPAKSTSSIKISEAGSDEDNDEDRYSFQNLQKLPILQLYSVEKATTTEIQLLSTMVSTTTRTATQITNKIETVKNKLSSLNETHIANNAILQTHTTTLQQIHKDIHLYDANRLKIQNAFTLASKKLKIVQSYHNIRQKNKKLVDIVKELQSFFSATKVYGLVSDLLLPIQPKYGHAVAVALGRYNNAIVVHDSTIASMCINYIQRRHLGHCTFLSLSYIKQQLLSHSTGGPAASGQVTSLLSSLMATMGSNNDDTNQGNRGAEQLTSLSVLNEAEGASVKLHENHNNHIIQRNHAVRTWYQTLISPKSDDIRYNHKSIALLSDYVQPVNDLFRPIALYLVGNVIMDKTVDNMISYAFNDSFVGAKYVTLGGDVIHTSKYITYSSLPSKYRKDEINDETDEQIEDRLSKSSKKTLKSKKRRVVDVDDENSDQYDDISSPVSNARDKANQFDFKEFENEIKLMSSSQILQQMSELQEIVTKYRNEMNEKYGGAGNNTVSTLSTITGKSQSQQSSASYQSTNESHELHMKNIYIEKKKEEYTTLHYKIITLKQAQNTLALDINFYQEQLQELQHELKVIKKTQLPNLYAQIEQKNTLLVLIHKQQEQYNVIKAKLEHDIFDDYFSHTIGEIQIPYEFVLKYQIFTEKVDEKIKKQGEMGDSSDYGNSDDDVIVSESGEEEEATTTTKDKDKKKPKKPAPQKKKPAQSTSSELLDTLSHEERNKLIKRTITSLKEFDYFIIHISKLYEDKINAVKLAISRTENQIDYYSTQFASLTRQRTEKQTKLESLHADITKAEAYLVELNDRIKLLTADYNTKLEELNQLQDHNATSVVPKANLFVEAKNFVNYNLYNIEKYIRLAMNEVLLWQRKRNSIIDQANQHNIVLPLFRQDELPSLNISGLKTANKGGKRGKSSTMVKIGPGEEDVQTKKRVKKSVTSKKRGRATQYEESSEDEDDNMYFLEHDSDDTDALSHFDITTFIQDETDILKKEGEAIGDEPTASLFNLMNDDDNANDDKRSKKGRKVKKPSVANVHQTNQINMNYDIIPKAIMSKGHKPIIDLAHFLFTPMAEQLYKQGLKYQQSQSQSQSQQPSMSQLEEDLYQREPLYSVTPSIHLPSLISTCSSVSSLLNATTDEKTMIIFNYSSLPTDLRASVLPMTFLEHYIAYLKTTTFDVAPKLTKVSEKFNYLQYLPQLKHTQDCNIMEYNSALLVQQDNLQQLSLSTAFVSLSEFATSDNVNDEKDGDSDIDSTKQSKKDKKQEKKNKQQITYLDLIFTSIEQSLKCTNRFISNLIALKNELESLQTQRFQRVFKTVSKTAALIYQHITQQQGLLKMDYIPSNASNALASLTPLSLGKKSKPVKLPNNKANLNANQVYLQATPSQAQFKQLASASMLSGGEKGLVSICVLLSIIQAIRCGVAIIDEVDANLDSATVVKLSSFIQQQVSLFNSKMKNDKKIKKDELSDDESDNEDDDANIFGFSFNMFNDDQAGDFKSKKASKVQKKLDANNALLELYQCVCISLKNDMYSHADALIGVTAEHMRTKIFTMSLSPFRL